jgi:hypothetical protein
MASALAGGAGMRHGETALLGLSDPTVNKTRGPAGPNPLAALVTIAAADASATLCI